MQCVCVCVCVCVCLCVKEREIVLAKTKLLLQIRNTKYFNTILRKLVYKFVTGCFAYCHSDPRMACLIAFKVVYQSDIQISP